MEEQNYKTIESIYNRIGAQNYQQLALFDKRIFLESFTSDLLFQQKDQLYYLITQKKSAQITKQSNKQPIKLQFNKFNILNDYINPSTQTLEIIGPSLHYKSQILIDLAETMSKLNHKILYISIYELFYNDKFKIITINEIQELFVLLSMLLENVDLNFEFLLIDGLSSLLYQMNQGGQSITQENQLEELHQIFGLLQKKGMQIIVTSVCKAKETYSSYNQSQDNYLNADKTCYKTIINQPWTQIWQAQLTIQRQTETLPNQKINKNVIKFQYHCFYQGIIQNEIIYHL